VPFEEMEVALPWVGTPIEPLLHNRKPGRHQFSKSMGLRAGRAPERRDETPTSLGVSQWSFHHKLCSCTLFVFLFFLLVPFIALLGWGKEVKVGWKMNRWEVCRGVLVKGGSDHGCSLGKWSLSGVTASCIGCERVGMFQVRSVGSEC